MMQIAALLFVNALSADPNRASMNNYAMELITSIDPGVSLWGGDVVFRNSPPPALNNTIMQQSWGLASPAGSVLRIRSETVPCDAYIAVYNNLCEGEEKQNGLLGQLDRLGWSTLPCVMFSETTLDGTEVRLPVKYMRLTNLITKITLESATSRVLVFLRPVPDANVPQAVGCPPKSSGPFPKVRVQHCPGLPIFPVNSLQPKNIALVIEIEQDGLTVNDDVEVYVGLSTMMDLIAADRFGNVHTGFELSHTSVLTFYQQAESTFVYAYWSHGQHLDVDRSGVRESISATVTGFPENSLKFDSRMAHASYVDGAHFINADFPVERSVATAYETETLTESPFTVDVEISTYNLTMGLYVRTPKGVSLLDHTKPFKIHFGYL